MTIRLRPHHLLCLLTYAGKGYSPAFTANYDGIAGRIADGEDIVIVEGPDDICAPLLSEADPHCRRDSVRERDRLAASALTPLLPGPVQSGARLALDPPRLTQMRQAFAANTIRAACSGCEWHTLCSTISANGYAGTRV
ncbi:MAG: DUF1284 domain-containing protein [Devosia sp.]|uniref:DUF1284 domain-containing protein n=1 Tax=Devosia sp. TaxID=1871048 RepID=UPI0024C92A3C|nr:DUF1284 domain-containing protein [Devosia sp.]UYO00411.1 MAG: DUF1284 domain-containing protein [Devosia sp.]